MGSMRVDGVYRQTAEVELEPELKAAYAQLAVLLAGCAVRGIEVAPELVSWADADVLLDVASDHFLAAAVGLALETCGVAVERARQEVARGIWRGAQLEADWRRVQVALDAARIWYCPVKGACIKDLWPFGLRQMSDYDVLFDEGRAEDVRGIMESLGFVSKRYGTGDDDVYHYAPVSNFEMHRRLFVVGRAPAIVDYWRGCEARLLPDGRGGYGRVMEATDAYLYLVAHAYKHWSYAGTGLRVLVDVYLTVCGQADIIDWERVDAGVEAMGIRDFERTLRGLSLSLLKGEALDEGEEQMLLGMCDSRAYGKVETSVINGVEALGDGVLGRLRYVRERLFLRSELVEAIYPFFARHPALKPLLFFLRLKQAVTTNRANVSREIRTLARMMVGLEP